MCTISFNHCSWSIALDLHNNIKQDKPPLSRLEGVSDTLSSDKRVCSKLKAVLKVGILSLRQIGSSSHSVALHVANGV